MSAHAKSLCSSGRNLRHAAVCDGCEKVSERYNFAKPSTNARSLSLVFATSVSLAQTGTTA